MKSHPTVLTSLENRSNVSLEEDVAALQANQGFVGTVVQPSTPELLIHTENMFSSIQGELNVLRDQLAGNFPMSMSRPRDMASLL